MVANLFTFNFKRIMNRYISRGIKIVVTLLLVIIADQVIGLVLRNLYFNQKAGQNQTLRFAFRDCKADIVVFGSSQAQHNYDPRIIGDSLNMSCYNAGQNGGHSILLQYAQIKILTERYSPKMIILDFHPDRIAEVPGDYDRLSILLPYYKEYPELRPLILLRSPYEKIKLMSAIYPFNSNIIDIIRYNTNTRAARRLDFEGYVPLEGVMNVNMLKPGTGSTTQPVPTADTNMINALENIISLCKEKNIPLFIISSPLFHTVNEKPNPPSPAAKLSLEIINRNKVNYIDFSFDPKFAGHLEWFYDIQHINTEGSKIYSNMIADTLRKFLKK